jgi:hypothetical protein
MRKIKMKSFALMILTAAVSAVDLEQVYTAAVLPQQKTAVGY